MPTTKKAADAEFRLRGTGHPMVLEVNTRVFLHTLSARMGKRVTLGTLPDKVLDRWAALGFDAVWMMGVWSVGAEGIRQSRTHEGLRKDFAAVLPDLEEEDIIGSPYAVQDYAVAEELGGRRSLAALRKKLRLRGLGLLLDFVPNHTARDHAWVKQHPEYYVRGKAENAVRWPETWFAATTVAGKEALAYGRDPYFPGWTDTAQLEYRNPATRAAMIGTLGEIAGMCDGVRCDMAMLVLSEVFAATWDTVAPFDGLKAEGEFWEEAIVAVKKRHPGFLFAAEAYWGKEWELQQLGFHYTYDKTLYDRLLHEGPVAVGEHLKADAEYQRRLLRFIENHDEPRAAACMPSVAWHCSAALIAGAAPGMVLIHEGQMEGKKVRIPVQLRRGPDEETVLQLKSFYERLLPELAAPVVRHGSWRLLQPSAAWGENPSWSNVIAYWWEQEDAGVRMAVANYAPHASQCYIRLPLDARTEHSFEFRDQLGEAVYVRERTGLAGRGMYFDLPPYGVHFFHVTPHPR
jgi:hypothetical protein